MKIYITVTFKGEENKKEVEHLCSLVREAGFQDFCFVRDIEKYQKIFDNPKELMNKAKEEILKCDALLIDFSEKSTGRTIEAGIAFDAGKQIIGIVKNGVEVKPTARGITDVIIEYNQVEDIVEPLKAFLELKN